jgi:hypothetical protein
MAKETPNAKRLKKEEKLKDLDGSKIFGNRSQRGPFDDGYGTSLSEGAAAAGSKAAKENVAEQLKINPYKTVGELSKPADVARRKAQREAAAEERREARGMKKGGMVSASKRADGCAVKGKTRGRMV